MSNFTYWYPTGGWVPGPEGFDPTAVMDAAERFETLGVTHLVIGYDGRKMSSLWDHVSTFDSADFRQDMEAALDLLFASGYTGNIEFMPLNGLYNWQTQHHAGSFSMIDATLSFIDETAHRNKVTGLVTDTEFGPTSLWGNADDAGKADILSQYVTLLEGIKDRVDAFDDTLTTATYHGAGVDRGDDRYVLDGVNYGDSAVLGAHVDFVILPIRLTDAIDANGDHDFDALLARAVALTADEFASLAGTDTQIIIDFEWEEAHRELGAPNLYTQLEAALATALVEHPSFAGLSVFIHPTLSTVDVRDILVLGPESNDTLVGTLGHDTIFGNLGDDSLSGRAGVDTIYGEEGRDRLSGGADDDVLRGGRGQDTVEGNAGADWMQGGLGADVLLGGTGADVLFGGNGQDNLFGENGSDTVAGGAGKDRLTGGKNADLVLGDAGDDVLFGGAGNDVLDGGRDDDRLFGGGGADVFVFSTNGFGSDLIGDFNAQQDTVVFQGSFREVDSFAAFADATQQIVSALVYDLGNDGVNRITLNNVSLVDLTEADVLFL